MKRVELVESSSSTNKESSQKKKEHWRWKNPFPMAQEAIEDHFN